MNNHMKTVSRFNQITCLILTLHWTPGKVSILVQKIIQRLKMAEM
jgi:hypothetical protein